MKNVLKKLLIVISLLLLGATSYISLSLFTASGNKAPVSLVGKQYYISENDTFYYVNQSAVEYFKAGDTILCKVGPGNDKKATLVVLTAVNKTAGQYEFNVRGSDGTGYVLYTQDVYGEAVVAPDSLLNTLLKLVVGTPLIMYGFTLFALVLFILSVVINRSKPANFFDEDIDEASKKAQQETEKKESEARTLLSVSPGEELDVHTEQLVVETKREMTGGRETKEKTEKVSTNIKEENEQRELQVNEETISTEEILLPLKDKIGEKGQKTEDGGITYGEFVQQVGVKQEQLQRMQKEEKKEEALPKEKKGKSKAKKSNEEAQEMLNMIDNLLDK